MAAETACNRVPLRMLQGHVVPTQLNVVPVFPLGRLKFSDPGRYGDGQSRDQIFSPFWFHFLNSPSPGGGALKLKYSVHPQGSEEIFFEPPHQQTPSLCQFLAKMASNLAWTSGN